MIISLFMGKTPATDYTEYTATDSTDRTEQDGCEQQREDDRARDRCSDSV
jgi:hypothetical protein